jgi:hypothetical protein
LCKERRARAMFCGGAARSTEAPGNPQTEVSSHLEADT